MNNYQDWADEVIEKIQKKMEWVSEKNKNKIPHTTDEDGNYDDRSVPPRPGQKGGGIGSWTNGFWGGLMWLLYQDTRDIRYAEIARVSEDLLKECFVKMFEMNHDLGFMYMLTAVADYRLTGNEKGRRMGLHAANLLAGRFNPVGRFIRAWNGSSENDTRGWAIIDCMMNLSILYWASEETNDPRFRQIAMMHADTTMENFVRPDGSVDHIIEFDPETGEKICSHGGQGYEIGSSWTRGQGWALYGFMISYLHTGKQEYLDVAKRIANYCITNIPENNIIPVDFRQPSEPAYEDSCGACIIAGGLLELAKCMENAEKEVYERGAYRILNTIYEKRSDWSRNCDAIVQNCSGSYHEELHHITMCYADFYFAEAIYKIKGIGRFLW